jgi:hypothetical protein
MQVKDSNNMEAIFFFSLFFSLRGEKHVVNKNKYIEENIGQTHSLFLSFSIDSMGRIKGKLLLQDLSFIL